MGSLEQRLQQQPWPQPRRYVDPPATVHVTCGGAGNPEMRIGPGLPPQGACSAPWCAFQSGFAPAPDQGHDFSYARVGANATHLHWRQVSVTFGRVIDVLLRELNDDWLFV